MKTTLLLFLFCVTLGLHVGFSQQNQPVTYSPGGKFDTVYDRFGNSYSLDDIKIVSNTNTQSILAAPVCDSGIFNLFFDTGSGFTPSDPDYLARRNIICQVFSDLSEFINSPLELSGEKVQIWVHAMSNNNAAGTASSFYVLPEYSSTSYNISGGIVNNEIWKTINSGTDSYTNVVSPLNTVPSGYTNNFYHGRVAINFNNINWHLDLNTNCPSNKYDLYTVILHEVTHALGFASLINYNGESVFGPQKKYFSKYDTFLKNNDGSYLISNGNCNSLYDNIFNNDEYYLHPGCVNPNGLNNSGTALDITDCNEAVRYFGPSQNIPVYTPSCFEQGSSLSHFEDMCYSNSYGFPNGNNNYFSMSNSIDLGVTKRFLKFEERQVLCDIGYSINKTYGVLPNFYDYNTIPSNGSRVVGINDGMDENGIYLYIGEATVSDPINIAINGIDGILINDYNGITNTTSDIRVECLQDVYDPTAQINGSSNPFTSTSQVTTINYTTTRPGVHLLRYTPVVNGIKGNITYVYVYVFNTNCVTLPCTIIKNGDFESSSCGQLNYFPGQSEGTIECWESLSGSTDIFTMNCDYAPQFNIPGDNSGSVYKNAPIPHNSPNNSYIGFSGEGESYQTALSTPLTPNSTYVLSFWATIPQGTTSSYPFDLYIASVNNLMPPIPGGANEQGINHFQIFNEIIPSDSQWHYYTKTFTFTETVNHNSVILLRKGNAAYQYTYIYIDDIAITPVIPSTTLQIPINICENETLLSLDNYLSNVISGGTFSGDNVIFDSNSNSYYFTSNSSGIYTINYTYIENNAGCPTEVTLSDTFEVLNCSTATTPQIPDFSSYCLEEVFTTNPLQSYYPNENGILISGTWTPSIIDTSVAGSFDYTFTPTIGTGQNAYSVVKTITIDAPITPTFPNILPLCKNTSVPVLLSNSNEGVSGTWSPAVVTSNVVGSFTYTFTPVTGACATPTSITIEVIDCNPTITSTSVVACEITEDSNDPKNPGDDTIITAPCLKVCENSTIVYTLTGNPSIISNTEWIILGGTLLNQDNGSCEVSWNGSSFAYIEAQITFINGVELTIHKCVEKVATPHAQFIILPNSGKAKYHCVGTSIFFDNLSTANTGNGELYFNWNFGDHTTATQFEPTHTYTESGTYVVTLTVFNGCSCVATYQMEVQIIEGIKNIDCPGIVCENKISTYKIDADCHVNFEAIGGEVISSDNNKAVILWNHIDESGFGTVLANCDEGCLSIIQVPVIQDIGFITGSNAICEGVQYLYRLPQWPTTDFKWSLDDGGTGATLIQNNQRNEIIVETDQPGTLILYCSYSNTLLGCGGNAEITLTVVPNLTIAPTTPICVNASQNYQFLSGGVPITQPIDYVVEGPNNFYSNGNGIGFTLNPTASGTYGVTLLSTTYCSKDPLSIAVLPEPSAPSTLTGPALVCPGTPVVYSVPSLSGAAANWAVSGGTILGPAVGNSVLIQFDPSATPPYLVNASYERLGCSSATTTLAVQPDVPVVTFIAAPTPVCSSAVETYVIQSSSSLDFVNWTITPSNAGSIVSGQNEPAVAINWNNGNTSAIVRATYRKCGIEHFIETTVGVNYAPVVSIVAPTAACAGDNNNIPFHLNGINPALSGTITWDFGNGDIRTGQTINYAYEEPLTQSTSYTVTVTVENPNGCLNPATASHSITIAPSPIVTIDHTPYLNLCNANNQAGDYTFTIVLQGGWIGTETITWYHNGTAIGNSTSTLTIDSSASTNPTTLVGHYYAVVTNESGCSGQTEIIRVQNNCPVSGNCTQQEEITLNYSIDCGTLLVSAIPDGNADAVRFNLSNGAFFIDNDGAPFQAAFTDLQPGEYVVSADAYTHTFNGICWNAAYETVIQPYEPDFKFQVTCTNGSYTLTLLDHSRYYDPIGTHNPITSYEFTTDGVNWTTGSLIGGVYQAQFTNLTSGTYTIGIRIQGNSYAACTHTEPLVLDNFPDASFTIEGNLTQICEGEPITLVPTTLNPEWTYLWTFVSEGAQNSNSVVQKTFDFGYGDFQFISLTVTNRFGCSSTTATTITVLDQNIQGELTKDQDMVCIGSPVTLSFNSTTGTQLPASLQWYKENQNNPINVPLPALTLTVTEPGYYFAYGINSQGCVSIATIKEVVVSMIPTPMAVIEGPNTQCIGTPILLSTAATANTTHYWSVNGSALPAFNGQNTIAYTPTTTGTYTFEVVAELTDAANNTCQSLPSTHTVTIVTSPLVPEIGITAVQCEPYAVTVTVANPQPDVVYYWSNGETGTTTTLTHDGPVQVEASLFNCTTAAQIDLPLDLKQHEWLFPKGCFDYCTIDAFNGYIIGPLGHLKWVWLQDTVTEADGDGPVAPIAVTEGIYQQILANSWCDATFGVAQVQPTECVTCDITIELSGIYCDEIFNTPVYAVSLYVYNNTNNVSLTLSAPHGEGYFSPSTFLVASSSATTYTGYFVPNNTFTGGPITVSLEGTDGVEVNCRSTFEMDLDCVGTPRPTSPKDKIIISPNPTADSATLLYEVVNEGSIQLLVTDAKGQVIYTEEKSEVAGRFSIDLSRYASGYYPVQLTQNGKILFNSQLIKK